MPLWLVATAVNGVIALSYLSIAVIIFRGVHAGQQWRSNPLAVATGLIMVTCGVGHAVHVEHLLVPGAFGELVRASWDVHLVAIDAVTAGVATWYFLLRSRFPALVQGAAIFEDLTSRRRQALDIHDNIVQELATAKLAFETGHEDVGLRALERGLASSRGIVTDLLGDELLSSASLRPGGLRRQQAAHSG